MESHDHEQHTGTMTPALFQRTSSLSLSRKNSSAEPLIVVRSAKSRCKKMSPPLESGTLALSALMALLALSSERAAI